MNLFEPINGDYNYLLGMAGDTVLVNDVFPIRALINNLPVNREVDIRTISSVSELKRGDQITWDSGKWLVISEIANQRFSNNYKGIIQRSNYNIKFVFSDGIVREFPAIVDSRYFDVATGQYFQTATGKVIVTMQYNDYSKGIAVNQRFIKMGNAFKVIGRDITKNGLLILHCDLDLIDPTHDDIEKEVANGKDYIYTLTITNGDTASIQEGATLQLIVSLQLNSVDVTDKAISYSSSNAEIATVDSNGLVSGITEGECTIIASMVDMPNIQDSISLTIQALPQNNYTYELIGGAEISKGYSSIYTAKKYNNGILIEDAQFDFTIIPGTTPTSAYSLTITNNTQCSITANQSVYYITLRATDRADNTQFLEKSIKLKNLF